jgi:hypothetical protein
MRKVSTEAIMSGGIFLMGTLYVLGLQWLMRPNAINGIYFHPWSSEDMMQTVPLAALRQRPIESVTHIHIQPPAFDAIRAALAQLWPSLSDDAVLVRIDVDLYRLGAILVGLTALVIFVWLRRLCGMRVAGVGTILFLLHPALMLFATFLDSTLLSAFLILLAYYLLWSQSRTPEQTSIGLSVAILALFFTRSLFQWPALLLFGLILFFTGVRGGPLAVYLALALILGGAYTLKQQAMFGIPWTSSFAGLNLSNSIGAGMGTAKYATYLDDPNHPTRIIPGMPAVLADKTKLGGQPNFNNIDYLALNASLLHRFQLQLRRESITDLVRAYAENAAIYFRPSSTYSSGNVIVERLPWRRPYDILFSAPVLPVLLTAACIIWVVRLARQGKVVHNVALFLPAAYVLLASVLGDRGENMRFKFFLEPVMYVFLVTQFYVLARAVAQGRQQHAVLPEKVARGQ